VPVRLLLIEDDDRVGAALVDVLSHHGFVVDRARTAEESLALLGAHTDVVVLDLGLPDRDGFEVCSRIRRERDVPLIIATARGDLASRVHGLHLGADDYLVKPFDVRELMARIHAVVRRSQPSVEQGVTGDGTQVARRGDAAAGRVVVGVLEVDVAQRTVWVSGRPIALTRKEFDLLSLLAGRPGVVFRREQILSQVWQSQWAGDHRTLEVHVGSIRAKTGLPRVIETVRGIGYRLMSVPPPSDRDADGGAGGEAGD
jgi:DNA-binding response OmpR family regulator